MIFTPDLIEKQISSVEEAWKLINNKLPQFDKIYTVWHKWFCETVQDTTFQQVVTDTLVISYARMSLRNGSISNDPRNYHSETHIDDLLNQLFVVSDLPQSNEINDSGWSLLSIFIAAHDLHQSKKHTDSELIGVNEQASFQEVIRILSRVDVNHRINLEHKELLKLMIHGSTFGKGQDVEGDIYHGNLVKSLAKKINDIDELDKELAYLACDIDTANVALDLKDYAKTSIDVYNEIQNLAKNSLSAHTFFGEAQEQYFFELQGFNSQLGALAFAQKKKENAPKVKQISLNIKNLDKTLSNEKVVEYYLAQVDSQT